MRNPIFLAAFCAGSLALAWACGGGDDGMPTTTTDAGAEVGGDDSSLLPDIPEIPSPDGSVASCALGDGTDPVQLCVQKSLLAAEIESAYTNGKGLASAWDSTTGIPQGHAWQDDLGLASTLASYVCSAGIYGDTEIANVVNATQVDLGAVLLSELPQAPDGYDGEVYFQLRNAAAGYFGINETATAQKLAQLADDFGRALQTKYAHAVPAVAPLPPPADAGDDGDAGAPTVDGGDDASAEAAGGGGGAGDGAAEGGAGDAGGEGGLPATVLGVPSGAGVAYSPAQVVMGAAALLDMAVLHAGDADAGAAAAVWQATAVQVLDYVWRRGRDSSTGLFYQALVTSGDPGHDALATASPASDALMTDVQAAISLGLVRAQDRFDALVSPVDAGAQSDAAATLPEETYVTEADALIGSLVQAKVWDGTTVAGSDPAAFVEGLLPSPGGSAGVLLTNKTTIANAYLLGAVIRIRSMATTNNGFLSGHLIASFVPTTTAHSNLLSVLTNAQGQVVQQDYLRASSRAFDLAAGYSSDGGAAGQEPGAANYRADALAAMIEGFTQRWRQRPDPPPCGM